MTRLGLLAFAPLLAGCGSIFWQDIQPSDAVKTRWDAIAVVERDCVDPKEQPDGWAADLLRGSWYVHWDGRRGNVDAEVDKKSGKVFCHYSNMGPPTGLP